MEKAFPRSVTLRYRHCAQEPCSTLTWTILSEGALHTQVVRSFESTCPASVQETFELLPGKYTLQIVASPSGQKLREPLAVPQEGVMTVNPACESKSD